MKDRIKQLMEAQCTTQANFAQMLGINAGTLSQILAGKANPSLNLVEAIRKGFPNLSYDWLLEGKGPMYAIATQNSNEEPSLFTPDGQCNISPKPQPKTQTAIYEPVPSKFEVRNKQEEKPERRIKEIVIYYDNNTFETFVAKTSK